MHAQLVAKSHFLIARNGKRDVVSNSFSNDDRVCGQIDVYYRQMTVYVYRYLISVSRVSRSVERYEKGWFGSCDSRLISYRRPFRMLFDVLRTKTRSHPSSDTVRTIRTSIVILMKHQNVHDAIMLYYARRLSRCFLYSWVRLKTNDGSFTRKVSLLKLLSPHDGLCENDRTTELHVQQRN